MRKFKIASTCLALASTFALFQNFGGHSEPLPPPLPAMPSLGYLDQSGKCNLRPTANGLYYYNAMISGGLNHPQILAHATNRLGFGASPLGSVQINKANDCTTVFIANEIAAQLINYSTDSYHLTMVRDRLLPTTMFSNYQLNRAVTRYQAIDPTIAGRLWYWSRTNSVKLMTLRELVGSQTITQNGVFDSQINIRSVMAQFWINHFNVDASKAEQYYYGQNGYVEILNTAWFNNFAVLTTSVIKSPAMLAYLDNRTNRIDPVTKMPSNQNLGRELLELYTLGVRPTTGIYSQNDVVAAAQLLAGHNVYTYYGQTDYMKNGYVFNSTLAANFPIVIMGNTYSPPAIGATADSRLDDLILNLAQHPSTKSNICGKLAKQFVIPSYYSTISAACVSAWGSNGNLPAVYKAVFGHPYFWSAANYRQLYRGPLDLPVATARAMGFNISDLYNSAMTLNKGSNYFDPEYTTAQGFVDFQNACTSTSVSWGFNSIHDQFQTLLGFRRGEVPAPVGLSYLGQDYYSSYFIDNVSRLALETGVYLAGQSPSYRNDIVSPSAGNAYWSFATTYGMGPAVQNYIQVTMGLGLVVRFDGNTLPGPYSLVASHNYMVWQIANTTSMYPVWTSSNSPSVTHGVVGSILSTSEFMKK